MSSSLEEYYINDYHRLGYSLKASGKTSRVRQIQKALRSKLKPGELVLDIGCGDLHLADLMPEYAWVGIDISDAKAKVNQKTIIVHDIMKTPYPDLDAGSFDAVVCTEVLEHVWDLRVIHKEVNRLLKANGTYVISTPNFDWLDHFMTHFRPLITDKDKPHTWEHIRQYNPKSHVGFLNETGFNVISQWGADAQYSGVLGPARVHLQNAIRTRLGATLELDECDMIVGEMFPDFSHTIGLVALKKE